MTVRACHQRKLHFWVPFNLRLHAQWIAFCAIRADDKIVVSGFITVVVNLGRILGIDISSRPFLEARIDCEGALVYFETRIADNHHFV